MKINLIEVETPMFSEFTMFAKPDFELLKRTKTIRVSVRQQTKTRISTTIGLGQFSARINFAAEGFKTHNETNHSFISNESEDSNYFIKSKKQGLAEYKEYVKKVIENVIVNIFKLELDEITIELEVKNF